MSGPTMFRCEGCIFYKPEGWMIVYAYGRPIREGPCRQYHFYNYEAARSACNGRLRKEKQEPPPDHHPLSG